MDWLKDSLIPWWIAQGVILTLVELALAITCYILRRPKKPRGSRSFQSVFFGILYGSISSVFGATMLLYCVLRQHEHFPLADYLFDGVFVVYAPILGALVGAIIGIIMKHLRESRRPAES